MNIRNSAYVFPVVAVLAVIAIFSMQKGKNDTVVRSPSLSPEITQSPSVTETSSPTPIRKPVKANPAGTPGIVTEEVQNYKILSEQFDAENRLLMLDEECLSLRPSQITYKNNTEVMIDNTMSSQARILKIGSREYSINANSWIVTTLSSPTVPARLVIFCGYMELGAIDLQ